MAADSMWPCALRNAPKLFSNIPVFITVVNITQRKQISEPLNSPCPLLIEKHSSWKHDLVVKHLFFSFPIIFPSPGSSQDPKVFRSHQTLTLIYSTALFDFDTTPNTLVLFEICWTDIYALPVQNNCLGVLVHITQTGELRCVNNDMIRDCLSNQDC